MTVHKIGVVWGYRFLVPEEKLNKIIEYYGNCDDLNNCLIKKLDEWKEIIKCEINCIICNHQDEGMVRYIDIGIRVSEFNISGILEKKEHRINEEQLLRAIADMKIKLKKIKLLDIWEHRVRDSASLYGLPDDCLYCD